MRMKLHLFSKRFISLFLVLFLTCLVPVSAFADSKLLEPTGEFYVADYANVLTQETKDMIVNESSALYTRTGAQIVVVTVDFLSGMDAEDYAHRVFNEWGIGSSEKNDGVLLLLAVGDKKCRVLQGKGLENTLTSGNLQQILNDYMKSDFDADHFDSGVKKTFNALLQRVNEIENSGGTVTASKPNSKSVNNTSQSRYSGHGLGMLFVVLGLIVLVTTFGRSRRRIMSRRGIYTPPIIFNPFGGIFRFPFFGPDDHHWPPRGPRPPFGGGGFGGGFGGGGDGGFGGFGGGGGSSRGGGAGLG